MKRADKFGRVLIVDSIYTLLLYLLFSTKEELDDTFFFMSERIPESIRKKFSNVYYAETNSPKNRNRFVYRLRTRLFANIRWPFLKKAEVFGIDHHMLVPSLLNKRGMTIVEDGVINYRVDEFLPVRKRSYFKHLMYGKRLSEPHFGASSYDKKVILTGIGPTPEKIKDKVEIIDIKALWAAKSQEERGWILDVYDLDRSKMERLQGKKTILLTQNIEKYGVPEDVAMEVYHNMMKDVDHSTLVIKPHPSTILDFEASFPDAYVFTDRNIPMELLTLIGVEFEDAYTISSTAVFSMPDSVNIHFVGTSVHPVVEQALGSIEYSDFVESN